MRSIGEMARASGLSVSALRFYDQAGVLVPAAVDPETGYRWYDPAQLGPARLVASLRRVGMPLAQITELLARWPDAPAVRRLLDAHLRRLEEGLADARRELSRVHGLLDQAEQPAAPPTRLRLAGVELAAALDRVRFAVGHDPELPVLGGVLFEVEGELLRLVATDRYRLAVAAAELRAVEGPPVRALVPATGADEIRALLAGGRPARPGGDRAAGEISVRVEAAGVTVRAGARTATVPLLEDDFPDYRRLLHARHAEAAPRRVTVDGPALRRALRSGEAPVVVREHDGVRRDLAVLAVDPDGAVALLDEEALAGGGTAHVAVNREFLLDALEAGVRARPGAPGQLVLELDGPIGPLAVRVPGDERSFSVLMPFRLAPTGSPA
ncbi:MerR family transcriptional regulator [Micromonospora sp. NPDC049559]|uniref:DNA polymerase III subunit beta family protein n=1 Tax=Micromonospora sp. NPDC049559 TaxID=3155923 RepID=UPI0034383AC8